MSDKPKVIIKSAVFVGSAVERAGYPGESLPEVAFAGRSNVGKSSLINCLLGTKKLVRTSRTPGRTQTINFFRINDAFFFVDLPGYGYAKVPAAVRARWGPMMETYLKERRTLRAVVQILDFRHPPTPDDLALWNWLQATGVPTLPVLTKADKVKKSLRSKNLTQATAALALTPCDLIVFSAVTREGRDLLWDRLMPLVVPSAETQA